MKRRSLLGSFAALACGHDKMQTGLDIGMGTSRGLAPREMVVDPTDPRNLPGSEFLAFWHEAERGITLDGPMLRTGTTTGSPAITLTGATNQALPIQIGVEVAGAPGGALRIWYAFDENGTIAARTTNVAAGATLALGASGITANLSGTFNADNVFNSVVKTWDPIVGTVGAAGHTWDNSTVTASPGCVYEAHGLQGAGIDRAAIKLAPGLLGNQGLIPALVAGNAAPFRLFVVGEMTILANTTAVLALFGFMSQSVANASIIDWIITGTTTTNPPNPPSTWGIQRITSTPATQRFNSDGNAGAPAVQPDLAPHIFEIAYSGTTLFAYVDGFLIATGTWSGTVNANRATLGGVKLAGGAATAFGSIRIATTLGYTSFLDDTKAAIIRASR